MSGKCHPLSQSNYVASFHQTGLLRWCRPVIRDVSVTNWNTKLSLIVGHCDALSNHGSVLSCNDMTPVSLMNQERIGQGKKSICCLGGRMRRGESTGRGTENDLLSYTKS